jgi:hypothetical protein
MIRLPEMSGQHIANKNIYQAAGLRVPHSPTSLVLGFRRGAYVHSKGKGGEIIEPRSPLANTKDKVRAEQVC